MKHYFVCRAYSKCVFGLRKILSSNEGSNNFPFCRRISYSELFRASKRAKIVSIPWKDA